MTSIGRDESNEIYVGSDLTMDLRAHALIEWDCESGGLLSRPQTAVPRFALRSLKTVEYLGRFRSKIWTLFECSGKPQGALATRSKYSIVQSPVPVGPTLWVTGCFSLRGGSDSAHSHEGSCCDESVFNIPLRFKIQLGIR